MFWLTKKFVNDCSIGTALLLVGFILGCTSSQLIKLIFIFIDKLKV